MAKPGVPAVSVDDNTPEAIALIERQTQAVALRRRGKSFRDIAKAMSCSVSTAHHLVSEALEHARGVMDESAEKLRQLELERVDELYDANYERAMQGSKDAAEICLKCIEKRSKLLGIEAPAKVEHSGSIDVATSAEEAKRKLAAILAGSAEEGVVQDADE